MILVYTGLIAIWVAFIYVQHHYGDRPTTDTWMAFMTSIGVFEYSKCAFSLVEGLPALKLALGVAIAAGAAIYMFGRGGFVIVRRESVPSHYDFPAGMHTS